jgi:hypothetical protein
MPTNETFIMLGLGAAALWFLNRGGSEEDQVDQLAGAAMMASGEGTAPDAPFQAYGAPSNPSFFFNQGGQMAKVTEKSDGAEDEPPYTKPELEFTVARSNPPTGTSDISPTTPQFAGAGTFNVASAAIWDDQAAIADANFMPLLAISNTKGGGVEILGSNVDIATLSSKEQFRAINLDTGSAFTTTGSVLGEYVRGFIGDDPVRDQYGNIGNSNIFDVEANRKFNLDAARKAAQSDEDVGGYPGGGNQGELEFTVARSNPPLGTSDISPTTPQFAGVGTANVTPATVWDVPGSTSIFLPNTSPANFFNQEGGAFGPSAVETIQSTIRPEPSAPAWQAPADWRDILSD